MGSRDRANVPLIIITITVWEVRAAPGFYLPANLYMEIVDNTAEPYTVLHLSVLSRIGDLYMEFVGNTAGQYTVLHMSVLSRIGLKIADLGRGYSVQRTSMGVVVQHFSIRLGEYTSLQHLVMRSCTQ